MSRRERPYSDQLHEVVGYKYPALKTIEATLQVTEGCTLACVYCYQHDKSPKRMSFEVAKKFIDRLFIDYGKTHFAVVLDFIGGEPLLEPELISKCCDYWDYQCIMHKDTHPWYKYIRFSMCSNGTEWDKPEVQKLMNHIGSRTSFTVSIDGNKELHDSARLHFDGSGSYDEAIHAATDYEKRYSVDLGSKMTIAPSNIIFLYPAIKHYLDSGKQAIHANTVYEKGWTLEDAQLFYKELKRLADYKLEKYPEIYISLFEDNFFGPMDPEDNQNWCGGTGAMIACDPDGVMYPCLRYMPTSVGRDRDHYVTCGDVDNGLDTTIIDDMQKVTRRSQSTDECFYCPIAKGCSWCSAYNWEETGSYNKRVTYICQMHQARALANVYYWNKYYRQTDSKKRMKNNVPEDWALKIIDKKELEMLQELTKE